MGPTVSCFSRWSSQDDGKGAPPMPGDSPGGGVPLPCLSSNNSTDSLLDIGAEGGMPRGVNILTGGHKRSAFVLSWELLALAREYGLAHLGFLTLTFADAVTELAEANRRFNSLNTHVIRARYERAVKVPERQRSQRLHFHLVIVLGADIRTG